MVRWFVTITHISKIHLPKYKHGVVTFPFLFKQGRWKPNLFGSGPPRCIWTLPIYANLSVCLFSCLKMPWSNFWKKLSSLPTKGWTCIQADSSRPWKGMGESQSCDLLICLYEIIIILIPTQFHMRHKFWYYNVDIAKPSPICQHGQSDQWLRRFPPWWIRTKIWSKSSRSCSSSSAATTGDHELALAPPEAKRTCNCRKSNQKNWSFSVFYMWFGGGRLGGGGGRFSGPPNS